MQTYLELLRNRREELAKELTKEYAARVAIELAGPNGGELMAAKIRAAGSDAEIIALLEETEDKYTWSTPST